MSTEFADDTTKFFCKVYYAEEFRKLRELLHLEGDDGLVNICSVLAEYMGLLYRYIRSLARCVRYEAKGGKSKSMFLKTFGKLAMQHAEVMAGIGLLRPALDC